MNYLREIIRVRLDLNIKYLIGFEVLLAFIENLSKAFLKEQQTAAHDYMTLIYQSLPSNIYSPIKTTLLIIPRTLSI